LTIGPDLLGCVNNVKPSDILICTDSRATKENMIKGIKNLVNDSQAGDSIVFYYSGHGSQMHSTEEPDKFDEVLCPHNMDFNLNFLSDNKLSTIFSKLPNKPILPKLFLQAQPFSLMNG
jgi:metacaspase-1